MKALTIFGQVAVPVASCENSDGTPLKVDADYFGKKRAPDNPFPGPFEPPVNGEIKVWPKR